MLIRDASTRWGGIHAMIEHGLLQKKVVNSWVNEREEELEHLVLSPAEWDLLKQLGDILSTFMKVTSIMLLLKTPTLSWVLPMYEQIKSVLKETIKTTLNENLRNAAFAGLAKLMTYYAKARKCYFTILATSTWDQLFCSVLYAVLTTLN
ncbi:hypothetical protein OBBRIDRAFT_730002 [Obba rivulosa]|uniref:Uncharacterized protein n=1 Tax=Obba rivulosa TaxID=1052685 RepID=A0A8E2DJW6_9APHY|nr:hypothetical protein OBBRIDRAFT_730002 [Obba rivulosa]